MNCSFAALCKNKNVLALVALVLLVALITLFATAQVVASASASSSSSFNLNLNSNSNLNFNAKHQDQNDVPLERKTRASILRLFSEPAIEQTTVTSQSQQQADYGHLRIGQASDKVTLPGDILLGGLFPIHMKGKLLRLVKV